MDKVMFTRKVQDYIEKNALLGQKDRVLAGISGGADSVCLLLMLKRMEQIYGLTLLAVHVNHGIRGEEAMRDADFVQTLCQHLQVECITVKADVIAFARKEGLSEEEAGRIIRYREFERIRRERGFDSIAVAHNENDNAETVLHNLVRGTGIKGLCGMEPKTGQMIRPLLAVSRKEIEAFLEQEGQAYVTDSTNLDTRYTRNKIRLKVLPYIEQEMNPAVVEHILEAGRQLKEIENYLWEETEKVWKTIFHEESPWYLDAKKLSMLAQPIKERILLKAVERAAGCRKDISSVHVHAVLHLLDTTGTKQCSLPYGLTAKKTYDKLFISKEADRASFGQVQDLNLPDEEGREAVTILPDGRKVSCTWLPAGREWKEIALRDENVCTKYVDYGKIEDKLSLRTRMPGDYLVINSAGNKKTLKAYLINEKVPKDERDALWLIADGAHILWIVGHRISAAYKVGEKTDKILRINLQR